MDITGRLFGLICLTLFGATTASAQPMWDTVPLDQAWTNPDQVAPDIVPTTNAGSVRVSVHDATGSLSSSSAAQCQCPNCMAQASGRAAGEPWTLPQPDLLQNLGIKMGGWLQQGVTLNAYNSDDGFNGPVATNDQDDEYQMNQLWLYFVRPVDTGGSGWDWGGRVDMIYGTDWRFGINTGLEDRINGFNEQMYGLVIPQAYLELGYNNLSVKLGHFAAILDYEAVPAVLNPFYSHSYSYAYTVPQLVTGLLADYKLSSRLSVQAGFHRGWQMFEDPNDTLDFMGGVKWSSLCQGTKIAYAVSVGPQDFGIFDWDQIPGNQDRFVGSLVLQQRITDRLQYVLVQNVGTEQNALPGGQQAEWYGINQYLLYTINPQWSANMRVEWLRDDDGARVAGPGNIPGVRAWDGRGFAGHFYDLTMGLSWRPNGNWIVRPEVRWDWYDGEPGPTGLPFDGGNRASQFLFAIDAILTF
jgi:hypothetical protein